MSSPQNPRGTPKQSPLDTLPQQYQPAGVSVPAGRSLADIPKGAPIPVPSGAAKKPNSRLTFRQLFTENESKQHLISTLKERAMRHKKGPWREYFEFFTANQSGDMDSMTVQVREKCEKIIKDVNEAYFEDQML